jgi:quercetin dioxygenase-like cupin family protein
MEPYRTRLDEVPLVPGLERDEGWVDMQVQFLVDKHTAGTENFLLGWTVLPPGARHHRHRHHHADEFFIVLQGSGMIYTDDDREPAAKGDVVFTPRGQWHGFDNTGDEDVVLVWGWSGAGALEDTGYEVGE